MPILDVVALFPDDLDIQKSNLRQKLQELDRRIGLAAPDGYLLVLTGELVAVSDDGLGPVPVSLGTVPVTFAGRAAGRVRSVDVDLGENLSVRDDLHCGNWLLKKSAASCQVALEAHPDPAFGVQQGFKCVLWRYPAAGSVQVQSSMTNTHPQGHSRIRDGGIATLTVDTELGQWHLHGETEV
jgi:hypothetical protein